MTQLLSRNKYFENWPSPVWKLAKAGGSQTLGQEPHLTFPVWTTSRKLWLPRWQIHARRSGYAIICALTSKHAEAELQDKFRTEAGLGELAASEMCMQRFLCCWLRHQRSV